MSKPPLNPAALECVRCAAYLAEREHYFAAVRMAMTALHLDPGIKYTREFITFAVLVGSHTEDIEQYDVLDKVILDTRNHLKRRTS